MPETLPATDVNQTANPATLGLFGFGMTTVLLNLHNAGVFEMNTMILAMGIFYGGLAQLIAGVLEWKKNNTFGMVAFTSYGCFWLTLAGLILMPTSAKVDPPDETAMAAYLAMWGLFTGGLFFATFRLNVALQVVFGTLTLLFFLLAIGDFTGAGPTFRHITGIEGVICGFSACYAGLAQVLNEVYARAVLPLGEVRK